MSTLLLRLAGPLQAWGDSSRFTRRETRSEPTKSGVLGMIAAAQGRRRTDPIEDLLQLRFGVRTDQPGGLLRDFQTAIRLTDGAVMPLSERFYLSDAVFLAGIEGDSELLAGIVEALRRPTFPLYLGRRSCPPHWRLIAWRDEEKRIALHEGDLLETLIEHPWLASKQHMRGLGRTVSLPVAIDRQAVTDPDSRGDTYTSRDVPVSFDPVRRKYGWRDVIRFEVQKDNNLSRQSSDDPDFFAAALVVSSEGSS
ncbi:type I-E CRISPR-associated protein Cas5/CasD [Nostocoides veronense]|uniref:Type I-E CRISPR-associated protein Cas5/CasD n=1 Tax=Nostocoides veronense TaxID=330836 RepID=A0ABN2LNU9_9MICO